MNIYKIVSDNGNIVSYVRRDNLPTRYEVVESTCTIPSFDHHDPDFDLIDEVVVESANKVLLREKQIMKWDPWDNGNIALIIGALVVLTVTVPHLAVWLIQ